MDTAVEAGRKLDKNDGARKIEGSLRGSCGSTPALQPVSLQLYILTKQNQEMMIAVKYIIIVGNTHGETAEGAMLSSISIPRRRRPEHEEATLTVQVVTEVAVEVDEYFVVKETTKFIRLRCGKDCW